MTVFSFEGPSRAGKTTTMDLLREEHPEWIEVVGPSLPERTASNFCEAWRQEMQLRKPIFEANPENVFIANRQFSELAYTHKQEVRDYVKRTLAMWEDVHIIYLTASEDDLDERNSPDTAETASNEYQPVLDAFPYVTIHTGKNSPEEVARRVEQYVSEVME
jgi:thymidylate kinase